jgi:hypothetical protein
MRIVNAERLASSIDRKYDHRLVDFDETEHANLTLCIASIQGVGFVFESGSHLERI